MPSLRIMVRAERQKPSPDMLFVSLLPSEFGGSVEGVRYRTRGGGMASVANGYKKIKQSCQSQSNEATTAASKQQPRQQQQAKVSAMGAPPAPQPAVVEATDPESPEAVAAMEISDQI